MMQVVFFYYCAQRGAFPDLVNVNIAVCDVQCPIRRLPKG
jgi:hypothetical protein